MKTLNSKMSLKGLNDLHTLRTMIHEFWDNKTYDWWHKVQPGDVVMDLGGAVGMFTCNALDLGAKRVYVVEPNLELLNTVVTNAFPHIVNNPENPVYPINCFIGSGSEYTNNGFGDFDVGETPIMSFKEIVDTYNIDYIDFLKVDCEGGEYNVFQEENYDYLRNNVGHIALEIHLDVFPEAPDMFIKFRKEFIDTYPGLVRFCKKGHKKKTWDDEFIKGTWPVGWGGSWMIYLTRT